MMCEYCNINDIDRVKALETFNNYKVMKCDSVVSVDTILEHMFAIYNDQQMADYAVKRIECRNVKCTPDGNIGVLAKDVVSELEALLSCKGNAGHNLDG